MTNVPTHVTVAPDSTGKSIDAQQVTSTETDSPSVLRQTVTLGDGTNYSNIALIDADGALYVRADELVGALTEMVRELRTIKYALLSIGNIHLEDTL